MHAGWVRIGRWLLGAGLATAVAAAHAQHLRAPSGGFPHVAMSRGVEGGARFEGLRANFAGEGPRGYPGYPLRGMRGMHADAPPRHAPPPLGRYGAPPSAAGYAYGYGARRFDARYFGVVTPVSAEARPVPRPPVDSSLRAGSIREDVARYNEERSSFRPLARGNGDGPRPPMPSPYRN